MNKKINLKIIKVYERDDPEFKGDPIRVSLINQKTHDEIVSGDYYHDHIDDRTAGVIAGFRYLGYDISCETTQRKARKNEY
jgi:hypothetical protein